MKKFALQFQFILLLIFILEILDIFDDRLLIFFGLRPDGMENLVFDVSTTLVEMILVIFAFVLGKKRVHQSLEVEKRYRHLIERSPEAILVHSHGKIFFVNRTGEVLLGAKNREELLRYDLKDFIHPESIHSNQALLEEFSNDTDVVLNYHIKAKRLDGEIIEMEITSIQVEYDGFTAREIIARDITVRKQQESIMEQLAHQDALTELPNRRAYLNKLEQLLADSNEECFAVMLLDLDGFKNVNDTLGHEAGDILLKKVSKVLTRCVDDKDMVARFAGDEFTILLPKVYGQNAILIANGMLDSLNAADLVGREDVRVTASIGIALYPKDGQDALTLLKKADMAMYEAKKKGKNRYQFIEE